MLARDKLGEARFFLQRLVESEKDRRAFRFYLSAFLNAARSVTWVLQKDLRSKHGGAFDEWWNIQAAQLGNSPTARMIHEARNISQKEGNRLHVRFTYRPKTPTAPSCTIEFDLDSSPITEQSIKKLVLEFPPGTKQVSHAVTEDADAAVKRWLEEHFQEILAEAAQAMQDAAPVDVETALLPTDEPRSAARLVEEFTSHLDVLSELVAEAGRRFAGGDEVPATEAPPP